MKGKTERRERERVLQSILILLLKTGGIDWVFERFTDRVFHGFALIFDGTEVKGSK